MKTFEELRIIPQSLWDAVQEVVAKRGQRVRAAGNPHKARRAKHLLSGLLICGSCRQTYVKVGQTRFGCREARKGACGNRVTIAQDRIEARVFDGPRDLLRSKDLIRAFESAFQTEMRQLEGEDTAGGLTAAGRKLVQVRKARGGIMKAIEAGADFAGYSARGKEPTAQEKALERQVTELKVRQAATTRKAPDIPAVFA